jgi:hypothetical protein
VDGTIEAKRPVASHATVVDADPVLATVRSTRCESGPDMRVGQADDARSAARNLVPAIDRERSLPIESGTKGLAFQ